MCAIEESYDLRTVTQYLTTRIRQADQTSAVSVRKFGQIDILVLSEDLDGTCYETSIYCYNGYLRELYCQAGLDLPPEFGEEILAINSFQAVYTPSLLHITFEMSDGTAETILLHLRSGKGVTP